MREGERTAEKVEGRKIIVSARIVNSTVLIKS